MAQLFRWIFSWWYTVYNVPGHGADELLNLCKVITSQSIQNFMSTKRASEDYLMNMHQCGLLVERLSETRSTLEHIQRSSRPHEKTIPVLQELHRALLDAERLIQSSCITTSEWLRAAIEQGDMKESFSKILYDVQWHTYVLQIILVDNFRVFGITFEPALCNGKLTEGDELSLLTAMQKDERVLTDRLRSLKLDDPTEKELANQLLKKLKAVEDQVSSVSVEGSYQLLENREAKERSLKHSNRRLGLDSSSCNLLFLNPQNLINRLDGIPLGRGSYAEVRETDLLGGKYAIKIFKQQSTRSFDQEMAALQGLGHHPHIVRMFCYSKNNDRCFLIMEKMDKDLDRFLQIRKDNGNHLSVLEAVVLMLQIAEGVRYIHSKHMAHRDLKPGNVLVNLENPSSKLSRTCSVKIADFGLTKTKNASKTYADQTVNTGTARYMAPEVIKAEGDPDRAQLNPMKADVYSFAIMCSEILTGENPFGELRNFELKKLVKASDSPMSRPNLPRECPEPLSSLIRRCWDGNYRVRPDFVKICQELRYIKGLILRGEHQKLQTQDVTVEVRSNVERAQEIKITSCQATSKRRFSSVLFEKTIKLCGVRRLKWTSQRWSFSVVLIMLFLLLSLGFISYYAKQHQVPMGHSIGYEEGHQSSQEAASTKGIKRGPWGRNEPNKLTGFFDDWGDSIKSIKLRYNQTPPGMGLMEVEYVKADGVEFKGIYGWNTIGSKVEKINFKPNEYIRQVCGSVAPHVVTVGKNTVGLISIVSLSIHTNHKSYGPFGDEEGKRFSSGTGKVIGFYGAAGALLDKIGVQIIPDGQDDGDQSFLINQ